jgi:hypothetical protein
MTAENFKTHTTGKKVARVAYLDAMKETLDKPDEVWINGLETGNFDNFTLIKFYTDEILVVNCRVEGGKVNQVKTWFPLCLKKDVINKYRAGLLINKSGQ